MRLIRKDRRIAEGWGRYGSPSLVLPILKFLPAYAPELNPVEYLWGHWKTHELPNFCPRNLGHLGTEARRALRRMRRRPSLVSAFWKQADLFD
jgi:transposase